MMKNETLFNKIGGVETINSALEILYSKIMQIPEVKKYFTHTDMRMLKLKKRMFLMMILGGPVHYTSKDLSTAHADVVKMGLNSEIFDAYIKLLTDTFIEVGINASDVEDIIDFTVRFKDKVLSGEKHPPMQREVEINSLQEYLEVTSQFNENTLYRGQGNSAWNLVPSIARLDLEKNSKLLERSGGWRKLEDEIMKRFIRHSSSLLNSKPETYVEWLVLAQHHGLPTRLLDWSQNSLVSLYFSVSNSPEEESVVWALDPKFVSSMEIDLSNLEDLQVYFPKNIDQKLVSQKGCFTLQPLPKGAEPFLPLEENKELLSIGVHSFSKIIIPSEKRIKEDILLQLANCGIDETFIYPDLYGLSRQIKRDIQLGIIRF